jgi:hypothetical protein
MSSDLIETESQPDLRLRALQRLTGNIDSRDARRNASAAFGVLHALASSPSTSAAALACALGVMTCPAKLSGRVRL